MGQLNHLTEPLTVHIPSQKFHAAGFDLALTKLSCHGLCICDIAANYANSTDVISFESSGIGISCEGNFMYNATIGFPNGEATVNVVVANSDFDISVGLQKNKTNGVPIASTMGNCKAKLNFQSLTFSDSVTGKLATLFKPLLESFIVTETQSAGCTALNQLINVNGTTALQDTFHSLLPFLTPDPRYHPLPESVIPPGGVPVPGTGNQRSPFLQKWTNTSSVLGRGLQFFDNVVNSIMGSSGVNTLIGVVSGGTGRVGVGVGQLVPLPKMFPLVVLENINPVVNITLSLKSIALTGLDSFSKFVVTKPNITKEADLNEDYSLFSSFAMDHFDIVATMTTMLGPGTWVSKNEGFQMYDITVRAGVNNAAMNLLNVLAMNIPSSKGSCDAESNFQFPKALGSLPALEELTIGQLVSSTESPSSSGVTRCLLPKIYSMNITQLNITSINTSPIQVSGTLPSDVLGVINEFMMVYNNAYGNVTLTVLNNIAGGIASDFANNITNDVLDAVKHPFPMYNDKRKDGYLCPLAKKLDRNTYPPTGHEPNYPSPRESDIVEAISTILNKIVAPKLDKGILSVTDGTGNFSTHPGKEITDLHFKTGNDSAIIDIMVQNVSISGIDTIYGIDLLNTSYGGAWTISNAFGIGKKTIDSKNEKFKIDADVALSFESYKSYTKKFHIAIHLTDLLSRLQIRSKVDRELLDRISFENFANIDCLAVPINDFAIEKVILTLELLDIDISCTKGCSPKDMKQLQALKARMEKVIHPSSSSKIQVWTAIAEMIFQYIKVDPLDILTNQVEPFLKEKIKNAAKRCVNGGIKEEIQGVSTLRITLVLMVTTLSLLWIGFLCCFMGGEKFYEIDHYHSLNDEEFGDNAEEEEISMHSNSKAPKSRDTRDSRSSFVLNASGEPVKVNFKDSSSTVRSQVYNGPLVFDPNVPIILRIFVTPLLLTGLAIFVDAHTNNGASVIAVTSIGKTSLQSPALFEFSLMNSIEDMWNAGVYPLSILIALFSGLWPYTKLILMLLCWHLPRRKFIAEIDRTRMLHALDALGKWSLIDAYVMCLFMVAFRFRLVNSPNRDWSGEWIQKADSNSTYGDDFFGTSLLLPVQWITADVVVVPDWGFYAFLIGALMSLVLGHVLTISNEYAENPLVLVAEKKSGTIRESVRNHRFIFDHGLVVRYSKVGQALVAFILLSSIILCTLGVWINTFYFTFEGAAGLVLPPDKVKTQYSFVSLASSIAGAVIGAGGPESPLTTAFGLYFIAVVFVLFVIALPICHLMLLLYCWIFEHTLRTQRKLFIAVEVLHAWASLEVMVLSVVSAVAQLSQFVGFIIGHKCDLIDDILADFFGDLVPKDQPKTCFDVSSRFGAGAWILLAGALASMFVGQIITRTFELALNERTKTVLGLVDKRMLEEGEVEVDENLGENLRSVLIGGSRLPPRIKSPMVYWEDATRLQQEDEDYIMKKLSKCNRCLWKYAKKMSSASVLKVERVRAKTIVQRDFEADEEKEEMREVVK
eukprot:g5366.t1